MREVIRIRRKKSLEWGGIDKLLANEIIRGALVLNFDILEH